MAYKQFVSFTKLTASDVNTYLMKQAVVVFADSTERTAGLTGVTLTEGMWTYLTSTKELEVYNGSAWVPFIGLTPIVPASVTVSAGSGTVDSHGIVTFSGTAYIRLNDVFTSYFSKYLVFVEKTSGLTTASTMQVVFGTGTTTAGDAITLYDRISTIGGTTAIANSNTFNTTSLILTPTADLVRQTLRLEVYNPATAVPTTGIADGSAWTTPNTAASYLRSSFLHNSATAYSAINIKASAGTFSGTVTIYGYN